MLKNVLFLVTLLVVGIFVTGCVPPRDMQEMTFNPQARLKHFGYTYESEASLISSKAPTRTTIVYRDTFQKDGDPNVYKAADHKPDGRIHFLAEPSPDVVMQMSESIALLMKAKYEKKITDDAFAASLGLLRDYTETAKMLTRRSQGVVYFRDAAYRLAEASLNGISSAEMYNEHMKHLFRLTSELIREEIPYIHAPDEEDEDPNKPADSSKIEKLRKIEELITQLNKESESADDPNKVDKSASNKS
ncbi:MAG: hypothetical protein ACYSUP_15600 [Planctomycetota bacterium]|jgi:hypothetical protein